ncbi:MAG TPA: RAD55 family ATPase [Candidatus Binatus sp.]|nr:RAD55 family ATPase [Candidatus Binatus sp.]
MGGLDEKLGGGIPAGSTILLISNQEGPVRLFCQQIAYILANEGHRIFYFTIVRDPNYIKEEMMVYDWDTSELEQGRQWTFIDAYSPRVQSLQQGGHGAQTMSMPLGPGSMSPGSRSLGSDLFVTLRREILSQLDEGDIVMIDSLSDLLVNHDAASVRELLEILGSQIHQRNGLVFMPILSDIHDPHVVATLSHMSDVVVEFELESEHLEGKLRFYKMRRAQLRPMLLPFSITDRGVMAETFGRVI